MQYNLRVLRKRHSRGTTHGVSTNSVSRTNRAMNAEIIRVLNCHSNRSDEMTLCVTDVSEQMSDDRAGRILK